jgi:hypothetical protein
LFVSVDPHQSSFHYYPIQALVTAMGRETLQRTVDIAQNT